jgi:aryl-alcohol dehydrogenase-like predicted oxidoreductase
VSDTADQYGESETLIGEWLSTRPDPIALRKKLIIATKFGVAHGGGASRNHILNRLEASLSALKTSYIDVYIIHIYDAKTPLKETLTTLNSLVREGKVRYIGLSNFSARQIALAAGVCRREGLEPLTSAQMQYSLLQRNIEWEIKDLCAEEGVGITCWSPLCGGFLSGKYTRADANPIGTRGEWAATVGRKRTNMQYVNDEKMYDIVEAVAKIADELKTTCSAVAIRWAMQSPGISSVIIGARTGRSRIQRLAPR